jgi:hypothetical protein
LGPYGCGTTAGTTPADGQDQLAQSSPFSSTTVVKVWF